MNVPATVELLEAAAKEDGLAMLSALRAGANPNATVDGTPLIMIAATIGDEKLVDEVLKAGADINARHATTGFTTLHYLAAHMNTKNGAVMLKHLIRAGANVNAQSPGEHGRPGQGPLEAAILFQNLEAANLLEEYGGECSHAAAVRLEQLRQDVSHERGDR